MSKGLVYLLFFFGTLVLGLTVMAVIYVNIIYTLIAVAISLGAFFFLRSLWKKASTNPADTEATQTAANITKVAIIVSIVLIIVGAFVYLLYLQAGPTGYVDSFTECGWCGGCGRVSDGTRCSLCKGLGGAYRTDARYTITNSNWIGVLIADIGIAIIASSVLLKKKHFSVT